MKKLIVRSLGGFAFEFENGWECGESGVGLGVRVSQLPANEKSELKFSGGMVISRKDCRKLRKLIDDLLEEE